MTEKQKGNPKHEHQPIHNQITGSHREGPGDSAKPPEPDRGELPPAEGYDSERRLPGAQPDEEVGRQYLALE